ncbi:FeoA family protein [Geovibrio ferrireducens]|jgi:Fe2+ transport system protein FeoA|uniref:FeoA family protein n=1 Tax=Geovibrio ferrireducens TaxID=46201 RepID=UPI00224863A0|nr:FeoA family protein [Geovibrio ferrireducens]
MPETEILTLSEMKTNEKARIKNYSAKGLLKQKLYNMGFIPGSEILMVRTAPLMDPIEVMVQNYFVTIRKEEAGIIEVELI